MVSNGARNKIGAPLAPPAAQATESAAIDAAIPRSSPDPVVFIIDDDVSVRESLHSLFRDIRLQSEVFASATELLASKLPDAASCLVLDVRLPGMSGLDFQAELARANIDVPIVFMSGYADVSLAVRAMKAGAVDFLTKPFREQDMLDAVAIAIARDRTRRADEKMVSKTRALFATLSPREREVMALVTSGLMNKQVAAQTGLAEATVKMHRGQVMRKMAAKSLVDLVKMAEYLGVQANNSQLRSSIEFKAAQKSVGRNTQSRSMDFTAPDFSYIRPAPLASAYPRPESRTGT
jgi:FixJ family two-component response regulator